MKKKRFPSSRSPRSCRKRRAASPSAHGQRDDESFNGRFREECLNVHWFASMEDAQEKIDAFRWDYNEHHPHRALEGRSPRELSWIMVALILRLCASQVG